MRNLLSEQLKMIIGGLKGQSSCSAGCPDGTTQSKDCGKDSTCSVSGTIISCGTDSGVDVCKGHEKKSNS